MNTKSTPTLHPRNRHQAIDGVAYKFDDLVQANPDLTRYIIERNNGHKTIDFADPNAVRELNRSLLLAYYGVHFWQIPEQVLCPPVPGRADYVHHLADLLASSNNGVIPSGKKVKGLDVGTGANLIYPIIGRHEYQWSFVGSELNPLSFDCATTLVKSNPSLKSHVKVKRQTKPEYIFEGIVQPEQTFTFTMCNPPFHRSAEEALAANTQKVENLAKSKSLPAQAAQSLNFGGQNSELWCDGGEIEFVCKMIRESIQIRQQVLWFSSLVSKKDSLKVIESELKKANVQEYRIIDMGQGHKISRFVAWTFIPAKEHSIWFDHKAQ